eukprot:1246535-Alexandrium_andersonii.AAC.1
MPDASSQCSEALLALEDSRDFALRGDPQKALSDQKGKTAARTEASEARHAKCSGVQPTGGPPQESAGRTLRP